jgi:pimeloyl-ACP methyl ester carboxylesterase
MLTVPVHRFRAVLGGVACCVAASAPAQEPAPAPVRRMINVDGYTMRVQTHGLDRRRQGSPVVVFEAGATQGVEGWGEVLSRVAASAPVIAYDRAGLGESQWDSVRPTPRHVLSKLRKLLEAIGAPPPYVLAGYSWGGMLARYFAGHHPGDVAGIVFVDPAPMVTQSLDENLTPFNAVGAGRAGFDAYWSGYRRLFTRSPPAVQAEYDVFSGLLTVDLASRDLRPLPPVPIVVIVAGRHIPPPPALALPFDARAQFDADLRWRLTVLQDWAFASPRGMVVTSNHITHAIPREDPELITWAVRHVLEAVRR